MNINKVMSILILFILTSLIALAEKPEDIKLNSFVNDYTGILTFEQKATISNELEQIFNSGEAEVAIVIINSLNGTPIEDFSLKVAQGNLGDTEKNNGLLILVAIDDRKYRFEVGRGIEPILNDAKIGRIGRTYIIPYFKEGDYYSGLYYSTLAIKSVLLNDTASEFYVKEPKKSFNPLWIYLIIFLIFFILPAILSALSKKKKDDNLFFAALVASELLRGGGRGGSGGFGGFGGGGFGGGGSGGNF